MTTYPSTVNFPSAHCWASLRSTPTYKKTLFNEDLNNNKLLPVIAYRYHYNMTICTDDVLYCLRMSILDKIGK